VCPALAAPAGAGGLIPEKAAKLRMQSKSSIRNYTFTAAEAFISDLILFVDHPLYFGVILIERHDFRPHSIKFFAKQLQKSLRIGHNPSIDV
jgi:hypothetical protein